MSDDEVLAARFEADRSHLHAVAYRMLGSASEADDAVQEAWLRLNRSNTSEVDNLTGWLTTVVARISLDMLRSRTAKREEPLDATTQPPALRKVEAPDPEGEAVLADSVGAALLVVLDTLTPAERLAFVLHDMFDVPFDEIAPIIGRTPVATRKLASRARNRVQGGSPDSAADVRRRRAVVTAFLQASRSGDFDGLLALLDPDVVLSGHIHQAPFVHGGGWSDRIGTTWLFNPGHQPGPVPTYLLIDLDAGTAQWSSATEREEIVLASGAAHAAGSGSM